jgi:hypothetical protein
MRTDLRKAHGIGCLPIHVKKYPDIGAGSVTRVIGAAKLSFFTLWPQQDDTEKKIVPQHAEIGKMEFNLLEIKQFFNLQPPCYRSQGRYGRRTPAYPFAMPVLAALKFFRMPATPSR